MNCECFRIRPITRMASAIAITLGITASAQDLPLLHTPRGAFQGKIDIRNANITHAATTGIPTPHKAPDQGQSVRDPAAICFPLQPRSAQR